MLLVLLSLLFKMLCVHGVVLLDFGKGIVVPLVKNLDGNKNSCDNCKCITISPVLCKVFESILGLMQYLQSYLQSDNMQFGLKKNSSCVPYVQLLIVIVKWDLQLSSVHSMSRVDHFALLTLLMD